MKKSIGYYEFRNEFQAIRPNNFSYDGLGALFDYLIELEEDTGIELELDVIAICCDFEEYSSVDAFNEAYNRECEDLEDVMELTTVIEIKNSECFIIQSF